MCQWHNFGQKPGDCDDAVCCTLLVIQMTSPLCSSFLIYIIENNIFGFCCSDRSPVSCDGLFLIFLMKKKAMVADLNKN